jgi:hypothetical protein
MRITAAVLMLLLGMGRVAHAEAPESPYTLQKEVLLPDLSQAELITLRLDESVYRAVPGSLESLQLRDASGEPIPYLVRKASTSKEETITRSWTASNRQLKPLPDNGLEITIKLAQDDPQPESLRIVTPLQNFEQRVQVLASNDGMEWTTVANDALIFDYSKYMDVRSDKIPLPAGMQRHFRIVVEDVTDEQESQLMELTKTLQGGDETQRNERTFIERRPFRIERIEFSHFAKITTADEPLTTTYPIAEWNILPGEDSRHSRVQITTAPVPLTDFRLQTSEKNFSRRAMVQTRNRNNPNSTWQTISTQTISRLEFKNVHQEHLTFSFSEARNNEYRIEIDNQDSPALNVTGVEALGNAYELIFLAGDDSQQQPEKSIYSLLASKENKPLHFDTAAIQTLLLKGFVPLEAKLGETIAAADLPSVPREEFKWSDLLNNKPVLFSAISVLVLALGWGLFKAAKRVDALPKE